MSAKRKGSVRTSRQNGEPPGITDQWIAGADFYRGDKVVRRGRPKLEHPRKLLSLRVSPEVIARWKATGPGWQTRMAKMLERSTPRSGRTAN